MPDLSLERAGLLTAGATMWSTPAMPEAGIPSFTMADGPMGVASGNVDERDVSTLTPCPTALGATWNVDLVSQVGRIVGDDAVALGVDGVLAPNLNLARSPLAGRAFEYFSEDPLLAGLLGAGWINGLQQSGTGAIAKHLVCNDSETDRDKVNVKVDERTLREVYLLPFELAAQAGCSGMLAAYNKVNDAWCSEQHHVLTEIVKREWKFPHVIMSDWFGTHSTAGALAAGLDLEMPGPGRFLGEQATRAAESGEVDHERVRDAAARVIATARRVTGPKAAPLGTEATDRILETAAAEGFVLLRNEERLLPLNPSSVKTIAVIGPNAAAPCYQGGTFAKIAVTPDAATPIESIRERYGAECEVLFEPGVDPEPRLPSMNVSPGRDLGDGCRAGMTLDYFATDDCSGEPVISETRNTNSLVWFVGVHKQSRFDQQGSVRASGRFVPDQSGTHTIYLGSTGEAQFFVDGKEVLRTGALRAPSDVMGILKSGEADTAAIDLVGGEEVSIVVEFRYAPARVQGLWYGIRSPASRDAMMDRAVQAAREADAVFLIVGETSDSSVESKDRPDTRLPPEQLKLINAVCAANPRTAVIVNVGHAFDAEWSTGAAALMVAWYPGQRFGPALASVLAGDREPSGRLPVTIARDESDYPAFDLAPEADGSLEYAEGVKIGYRGLIANGTAARFPFGSGSGYADFEISDAEPTATGVSVTVRNVSDRRGSEVLQLYRDGPECVLIGFAKVSFGPREQREINVPIEPMALRQWEDGWQDLPRPVQVRLARHAEDPGQTFNVIN